MFDYDRELNNPTSEIFGHVGFDETDEEGEDE